MNAIGNAMSGRVGMLSPAQVNRRDSMLIVLSKGLPGKGGIQADTHLLPSLINQLAQLLRTVHDFRLVSVLGLDLLSHLGIFPRSTQVQLPSAFEFLLTLNVWVEDPLPVVERDVGLHGSDPLVEGLDLLFGELAVQHLEVVAEWREGYARERRLAMKRLLLRYKLLAMISLAP